MAVPSAKTWHCRHNNINIRSCCFQNTIPKRIIYKFIFDNFEGKEILSERNFQDYQSEYIDLYQKYKSKGNERKENINDDVVFEIELVKQVEINIDYILMLVKKYQFQHPNMHMLWYYSPLYK